MRVGGDLEKAGQAWAPGRLPMPSWQSWRRHLWRAMRGCRLVSKRTVVEKNRVTKRDTDKIQSCGEALHNELVPLTFLMTGQNNSCFIGLFYNFIFGGRCLSAPRNEEINKQTKKYGPFLMCHHFLFAEYNCSRAIILRFTE